MFRSIKFEKLDESDSDSEGTKNWKKEVESKFQILNEKEKIEKEQNEQKELAKQMDIAREKQRQTNKK
jgi:hypothetical protein